MLNIFCDFETFSFVPIKSAGASRYARDKGTDVQCMAWCIDGGVPQLWVPWDPCPPEFHTPSAVFHAHNAAFEIAIWERVMVPYYGWPSIPLRRWRCTAARAAHAGLPRSLEGAANALGVAEKDMEGHRVMLWLCAPQWGRLEPTAEQVEAYEKALLAWRLERKDLKALLGIPIKDMEASTLPPRPRAPLGDKLPQRKLDEEKLGRLYEYCANDVRTEVAIHKALPPLPESEQLVWRIDRTINERGVPVDLDLCRGAVALLAEHARRADARLRQLTGGRVTRTSQRERILQELRTYDPILPDVKRETLEKWEWGDPVAAEVAAIRRDSGAASVKKMRATLDWADEDGRARNTMYYYAAGTGRWGGRGPQFQNMKRGAAPSEEAVAAIASGDYDRCEAMGPVLPLIASATRSIVCAPPGWTLVQSDYASIEARVLAWLADDEPNLAAFAADKDIYKALASRIYGVPEEEIDKPKRQLGKCGELGLGYGCGSDKFQAMAGLQGIAIDAAMAFSVVDTYRSLHPNIVQLWRDMEGAAVTAVRKGQPVATGHVGAPIVFAPEGAWLTLKLPSGRKLYYYKPEIADSKFGKPSFWYTAHKGRMNAYGGLLVENAVQAIARDLLVYALGRLERLHMETVLHVHDSCLVLAREKQLATAVDTVHAVMSIAPEWAGSLPVKAETIAARRMK